MTTDDRRKLETYLWDPAAEPSAEVRAIEQRLAPVRFDAGRHPLRLPPAAQPASGRYGRHLLALAATVALLVAGAWAYWSWRSSWPAGAGWPTTVAEGASVTARRQLVLQPDRPLRLDLSASARVEIARIGTMTVAPGSVLTVAETTSRRHRVQLDRGTVSVRVWAPPGRFAFATPAGNVIDLGCVFDLAVDADGMTRLRVETGWVQMENVWGESLVPAGASSVMTAAAGPGVPVYDDSAPAFSAAVRAIERAPLRAVADGAVDAVVRTARSRDVLTLLMLARRSPPEVRRPMIERAAQLFPPPPALSVTAIAQGDDEQLWRWYNTLPLPSPKSWWLNWRDALPRFH